MELWRQLGQSGLLPQELGPPSWALRGVPRVDSPGQTLMSPAADPGGARESLLWIWEELENMRRVDVQLLGQLCSLGLEMEALREELTAILEEEEESSEEEKESSEEEEEDAAQGKEEGHWGASCPEPRLPDFEMTI
ncbi:glutamate-rich protein 4 [Oryctolagus cuniculus]|uniref:glutamate-rich protein 4 n=1 Tax=Oryctolagus cuniculus TaxID=9986 RepID=UPI003878FECB